MRPIDLADMLEEQYKNKHVQCNMNIATCGNRPCDLCRIEQFARDVRADVIDECIAIVRDSDFKMEAEQRMEQLKAETR